MGRYGGWAENMLYGASLEQLPVLETARVRKEWEGFVRARTENYLAMWTVVTFQAWWDRWGV